MKPVQTLIANEYSLHSAGGDTSQMCALDYSNSPLRLVLETRQGKLLSQKKQFQDQLAAIVSDIQETERKIIGQELHDNVNQILMSVKLMLEMMHPVSKRDLDIQEKSCEYILAAINEIRKISGELVVSKQKVKGLAENIQGLVDDLQYSTGIKITFNYSGEIECLEEAKKTTLLRIVQEQLNNIIKYSKAEQVWIELHIRDNKVKLLIKDDGIGFDSKAHHHGIGLLNITERARSHKGTMYVQTSKGKGCILSVNIPAA